MTWLVQWNGKEYDVDPNTFNGLELSEIKKRAGYTYKTLIMEGIPDLEGDAIRALFWTVDRRDNPALNFGDYQGPPIGLIVANLGGFVEVADELGKALKVSPRVEETLQTLTTEMLGSQSLPSPSLPTETEPSTTG